MRIGTFTVEEAAEASQLVAVTGNQLLLIFATLSECAA